MRLYLIYYDIEWNHHVLQGIYGSMESALYALRQAAIQRTNNWTWSAMSTEGKISWFLNDYHIESVWLNAPLDQDSEQEDIPFKSLTDSILKELTHA